MNRISGIIGLPLRGREIISELEDHELANVFPLLDGEEFDELRRDVEEYGVRESVVLYEGKILDGRNRSVPPARPR